ncbi:MAG: peptidoglycan-binding domain-containing protein [Myxococcota bacterium]
MCPSRSRAQDSRRRHHSPSPTGAAAGPRSATTDESNEWARARLLHTDTAVGFDGALGEASRREGGGFTGPQVSGRGGAWRDEESGRVRMGAEASASVGSMDLYHVQATGPSAVANCSVGDDGVAVGAQASAGDVSFDLHNRDPDEEDILDGRVGFSEGLGLEVRGHWADRDHDGRTEYGFGMDVGPFSFDATTESIGTRDREVAQRMANERRLEARRARAEGQHSRRGAREAEQAEAPQPEAVSSPVVDHGAGPASAGPVWNEESRTSVLAARTGRPMNQLMQLQLQGGYHYDRREIRRALREFQREQGLEVTGEYNPETIDALGD